MNAASVNTAGFTPRQGYIRWAGCVVWLGFYSEMCAVNTQHTVPSIFEEPIIVSDMDFMVL